MSAFKQPISEFIWKEKYRLKTFEGEPIDETVEDTWLRISEALVEPEKQYLTADRVEDSILQLEEDFYNALEDFKFIPAGRINSGAGTGRAVTLMNCFVMGNIKDDMRSIFENLTEAALTMQQGGGIGYCFSSLRPQGAHVKGVDSDASGPLTFMDVWDSMCRTIMSAGSRRGAMMATMHCWHPDIEKFIEAKRDPLKLRMFNMSVLITDPFMDAVKADADWNLEFNGKVYKTIKARTLWDSIMMATYAYAEPGVIFIDRINDSNNLNYCEEIVATNPCVRGDTLILTESGYQRIDALSGKKENVWNGYEFSNVDVKITGENMPMKTVVFSDGSELDCTYYHKFILSDGSRIEAKHLSIDDKLVKCDWPIIDGSFRLNEAYQQGFFTGDGWVKVENGSNYIGLYGDKKKLLEKFTNPISVREYNISGGYEGTDISETKIYMNFGNNHWEEKFFVPNGNYALEDKLAWLTGLVDSDGHVTKDGCCQISAKDREFLMRTKRMLNTCGVNATVSNMKEHFRLSISAYDFNILNLDTRFEKYKPSRNASRFVKVLSVEEADVADKVYCFNEPKNHSGVFGGVITAQCGEQPLPEYGACLLGSINLSKFVKFPFTKDARINFEGLVSIVKTSVRMMDNVNDITKFPLPEQEESAKAKRRIGLGVTGLADMLVMLNSRYGSEDSVIKTDMVLEAIKYAAYEESIELAKVKGSFPALDVEGFLNSGFMSAMDGVMHDDIREHGIRNALLLSIAPTGTISMYANNVSSGIEPIFAHKYERKVLNKDGSHTVEIVKDYAVHLFEEMFPGEPLNENFVSAQTLTPEDHIRIQAVAQKHIDSSISKTTNCPEDISFDDFKSVYMMAYDTGCKGCTTYRPNEVTGSVLTAIEEEPEIEEGGACIMTIDPDTGQMIRTCDS